MNAETVPVAPGHAEQLAATMRPADALEVARIGLTPLAAVEASLRASEEAWAVLFGGELAAIYGVSKGPEGEPDRVWCLTSTVVDRAPLTFWRESKAAVLRLARRGPMFALVDAKYDAAMRWADRLGFKVRERLSLNGSEFAAVWR